MIDDDIDERWRDELLGTPSENEAMRRDMIARSSQSAHENTLAWARQRAEARSNSHGSNQFRAKNIGISQETPMNSPDYRAAMRDFVLQIVRQEMRAEMQPLRSALAQLLGDEFRRFDKEFTALRRQLFGEQSQKHDDEIASLRRDLAELTDKLATRSRAP